MARRSTKNAILGIPEEKPKKTAVETQPTAGATTVTTKEVTPEQKKAAEDSITLTQAQVDAGGKQAEPMPVQAVEQPKKNEFLSTQVQTTPPQATQAIAQQAAEKQAAAEAAKDPYEQYIDFLKSERQRSDEEEKAQRRREMLAAIGQGIGSISDLYAATQEAPLPQNKENLSDKMRERYTRIKAQADADRHARTNEYLRSLEMKRKSELDKQTQEYNKQRIDIRRLELEERRERYAADNKAKALRAQAAAAKDEATARKLLAQAVEIETMTDPKKANMEADTYLKEAKAIEAKQRGSAAVTNAAANQQRANNSGSGNNGTTTVVEIVRDKRGREVGRTTKKTKGSNDNNTPPSRRK